MPQRPRHAIGMPVHVTHALLARANEACVRKGQSRADKGACVSAEFGRLRAAFEKERERPDGCPAPSPLVEAVAAGVKLTLERSGRSCAVRAPAGVLAFFRSCDAAEHALKLAKCSPAAGAAAAPSRRSSSTRIFTPQNRDGDPARYVVMEAEKVIASHEPMTFAKDRRYPEGVQERQYHSDKNEQGKVALGAQNLVPIIVANTSPTATDGPPMVTEDGCALGGNGRTMMLKRAYGEGGESAKAYRAELVERARDFGLDPADVRRMKEPILVRVVEGLKCDSSPRVLGAAVRRYNESLTQALDPVAEGVAKGRQLSPATVSMLGSVLAEGQTLRAKMDEEPRLFLRALEADGIVTSGNRSKYSTEIGKMTPYAKDELEAMFLGRVLGTADRIHNTSAALRNKVERAVPYLAMVAAKNPDYDLTAAVVEAVDLLNEAESGEKGLEFHLQDMPLRTRGGDSLLGKSGGDRDPEVIQLARMLEQSGQNQVRDRFKTWAGEAAFDAGQSMLGSRPPTREQAFEYLTLGTRIGKERAIFRGTNVLQPVGDGSKNTNIATVTAIGEGKGKDKNGIPLGKVEIQYLNGKRKGETEVIAREELGELAK